MASLIDVFKGKDDPVMLVGFSQGGIMAGHLAAYSSQYNWQAVIASGAPIDGPSPHKAARWMLVALASVALLAGCVPPFGHGTANGSPAPGEVEVTKMDNLKEIEAAILASDERIVGVDELKFTREGFTSSGVNAIIEIDSIDPLSEQTLKSLLDAIYYTSDPQPIYIGILALAVGTEEEVDIRPAATALVGESAWRNIGRKGATFSSGTLKVLYGTQE